MSDTPQPNESVEKVMGFIEPLIREFNEKFQRQDKSGIWYAGMWKEMRIQDFINFAYAEGRASMKRDIEAMIMTGESKNVGIDEYYFYSGRNSFRCELLTNIKGIV